MFSKFIGVAVLLVLLEYLYFALAKYFRITDKPNLRSSHADETIRGGGIIFLIAALLSFFIESYSGGAFFFIPLIFISLLSFVDDIISLSSLLRLCIQSAVILGFLFFSNLQLEWYLLILCFIIITGIINAYNFMDGINGMTVLYSLTTIGTLFWINQNLYFIINPTFFLSIITSLVVFAYFNLRKKAICFAGDVGSVSIAFIICFVLFKLISNSGFIYWFSLLGLYGIDTIFTIFCRILRKEQIMKAHRSHFYQFLVNEKKISHVRVSLIYATTQLILNVVVIVSYILVMPSIIIISLLLFILMYIIFRLRYEGMKKLFIRY